MLSHRRFLTVVLLLLAFFNALAGAPLHEAQHIRETALGWAAGVVSAAPLAGDVADGDDEVAHRWVCHACLAHWHELPWSHPQVLALYPAQAQRGGLPLVPLPPVVQRAWWPFASRAPPATALT